MADKQSTPYELMTEFTNRGNPKGWFEELYKNAGGEAAHIPWADLSPNPNLVRWLGEHPECARSGKALVVGCGLGDDAELLASRGLQVTAFDISPTAIEWCRTRFTTSKVDYRVADACAMPSEWMGMFDFVFEANTLQALPLVLRNQALIQISQSLRVNGELLVIARAREPEEPEGNLPWPLTRGEFSEFERRGLKLVEWKDFIDDEVPPVRRFCVLYSRPA
jgi:SAM-dependent methyltransferase